MKNLSLAAVLASVLALVSTGCNAGGSVAGAAVTLTPNAGQTIDAGQQVVMTAAVAHDSAGAGVTWSCAGAACTTLTNVSATSATFNASGASGGATITATSVKDATATASLAITVSAAPAVTTSQAQVAAAPAIAGIAYSLAVAASGGSGALTWSATGLGDGLSINSNTGTILGTPASKATVTFTVTVTDSSTAGAKSTSSVPLTLAVSDPAPPTITTTQAQLTAAPATAGTAYHFGFQGTGTGTLTWSATGLPADSLSLGASTGVVTGTPGGKATLTLVVTLSDTSGQSSAPTAFVLMVNDPPAPVITTTQAQVTAAPASAKSPYTFTFHATGTGTLTWSAAGLPADGLSLNATTGVVSGTPTAAGPVAFSLLVSDTFGQSSGTDFTITVNNATSTESIAFTPAAPSSVTAGGQLSVNATVSNDAGAGGVDWTVTCTTGACGGFTAAHTVSGTATTFNAPAQPPSGGSVTITATAHDAPSPQVSAVVTVNPLPLTITPSSLASGTVNVAYNATITASGGVAPYTFTMDAGSTELPANLVFNPGSPSATITGTPAAAGTTNNIIIDVADSESVPMTAQITFSITVSAATGACGSGSESLLNGQYAILLQGFDSRGPVDIGATFDADGAGNIATTVGIEDINSVAGVQTGLAIISANSSYSVGSDHRGCLTIATSAGTQIFRFALSGITAGVASAGNAIEFDATGSNSAGMIRLQDSSAFSKGKLCGNYAFGVSAPRAAGGKFAAVGLLTFDGSGGISPATSVLDSNENGTIDNYGTAYPASPIAISSGSYSIGANGRGTLSFVPGTAGHAPKNAILYVLSSSEVLIFSTDAQSCNDPFAGSATLQSGGPFSDSSMSGSSVLYATGIGNNGGTPASLAFGAIFTVTSSGVGSLNGWSTSGGTVEAQSASGFAFTVASNGRVTLPGQECGGQTPILYLVKPNMGYLLFTDGTNPNPKVQSGAFRPQSAGPFSTSTLDASFAFGTTQPDVLGVDQQTGIVAFDGAGNIAGTSDGNTSGTLKPNQTFTGTYSIDSTGLGVVPSGCTAGTNCNNVFFLISPTSFVLLDTSSDINPDLELVEE